jgi:hypothetical protein
VSFSIFFCSANKFNSNKVDLEYYESLLNKRGYVNPTLMIEDSIKDLPKVERSNVIIGGNLVRYYGGFNSLVVGLEIEDFVYAPSMGRMHKEEKLVQAIKHIPYYSWVDWIAELNKYKYAVHLNPNSIAGTFSLNCAYLGIPCIGNINSDAQRICYPNLSSHPDDLKFFKKIAKKLKEDNDFYMESSEEAKINYMTYYSEEVYKNTLKLNNAWKQLDKSKNKEIRREALITISTSILQGQKDFSGKYVYKQDRIIGSVDKIGDYVIFLSNFDHINLFI